MHISLIGMSNIGKSCCSRDLAAHHKYRHIDCDALIEKKLKPELGGLSGIQGMAKWMGFPWEDSYKTNSVRYLDREREVLGEALEVMTVEGGKEVVLDTTGSVVYTGDEYLEALRAKTLVVYFEASEHHIDGLFRAFLEFPKPVIWGDSFRPLPHEIPHQTMARCYPELLRDRAARYKKAAHMVIPFSLLKDRRADIGVFVLNQIRQS